MLPGVLPHFTAVLPYRIVAIACPTGRSAQRAAAILHKNEKMTMYAPTIRNDSVEMGTMIASSLT